MTFKKFSDAVEVTQVVSEECYLLTGKFFEYPERDYFFAVAQQIPFTASSVEVDFDWKAVYEQEDKNHDVIGFYHTHPFSGNCLGFSETDIRAMKSWCSCFGKNLLCVISDASYKRKRIYLFSKDGFVKNGRIKLVGHSFKHQVKFCFSGFFKNGPKE